MKIFEHPNCSVEGTVVSCRSPFTLFRGSYIGLNADEFGYAVFHEGTHEPLLVMHPFTVEDLIAKLSDSPVSGLPHFFEVSDMNGNVAIRGLIGITGQRRGDAIIRGGFSMTKQETSVLVDLLNGISKSLLRQACNPIT